MNIPTVPATDRALKTEESNLGRQYVSMRAYAWSDAPLLPADFGEHACTAA